MYNICKKILHHYLRIQWSTNEGIKESAGRLRENISNSQVITNMFGVLDGEELSCAAYVCLQACQILL